MVAGPDRSRRADAPSCGRLIEGVHDVRIPVSDVWRSRDWYVDVLGFESVLDLEEETAVVGVVLRHPSGVGLGLHRDPPRAAVMRGFVMLALVVSGLGGLEECADVLDRLGEDHSTVHEGHLGWYLDVPDPDGILVRLHTAPAIDAEEA